MSPVVSSDRGLHILPSVQVGPSEKRGVAWDGRGRTIVDSMIGLLLRWLVPFLAVLLAAYLVPEGIIVSDYRAAAIFAFALAVLNAFVRPVVALLALPITCLTLGLFHIVINAVMFGLAATLVPGVRVEGVLPALVGALLVSALGLVMSWFFGGARSR